MARASRETDDMDKLFSWIDFIHCLVFLIVENMLPLALRTALHSTYHVVLIAFCVKLIGLKIFDLKLTMYSIVAAFSIVVHFFFDSRLQAVDVMNAATLSWAANMTPNIFWCLYTVTHLQVFLLIAVVQGVEYLFQAVKDESLRSPAALMEHLRLDSSSTAMTASMFFLFWCSFITAVLYVSYRFTTLASKFGKSVE